MSPTKTLSSLLAVCISISAIAQSFPVDTIIKNGALSKRVNFVYLSDGYLSTDMNVFATDVVTINNKLFLTTPFKEYANYFNIFRVRVPSAQAGAKHGNTASDCPAGGSQPTANPLNYFGSKFDYGGIHRLLVADSFAKLNSVLASSMPSFDQAFVVVKSPYYGGSGGTYAVGSTEANSAEVMIHEIGHSFGKLADEYWAGTQYAAEKPNMTAQSDPLQVKWKTWVGSNNVGVYPYNGGAGWYRPVTGSRCKMEVLNVPFCSVCSETIIERIHSLISPIDNVNPANGLTLNAGSTSMGFKLDLVLPNPNTLKVTWQLDGVTIANNVDTLTVQGSTLSGGNHTLRATVVDTTALLRVATHPTTHLYNVSWVLSKVTGISSPVLSKIDLQVFPNPASKNLHLGYELDKKSDVGIVLVGMDGKRVYQKQMRSQPAGRYSADIDLARLNLSAGTYMLVFSVDGGNLVKEIVKVD